MTVRQRASVGPASGVLNLLRRLALVLLCFAAPVVRAETAPAGFILEVEMADMNGGTAQLFYNTGYGYNQRD